MKITIQLFLIFLFFLAPQLSYSWTKVGNGGFMIECDNNIQVLDLYEGVNDLNLTYKPIPGINQDEKVEFLLKKLEKLDPNRARSYRFQYNNFWHKLSEYSDRESIFTLDHRQVQDKKNQEDFGIGDLSIPENCLLKLALQQKAPDQNGNERNGRLKLIIYEKIWNEFSEDTKAILALHELFYRENILLSYIFNSSGIRKLNAWLISNEFNHLKREEWEQKLRSSGFSPMFPMFYHKFHHNEIDLETALSNWAGYKIFDEINGIMHGTMPFVELDSFDVVAQSPFYYKGNYPEYFTPQSKTKINLSSLSDRNLIIYLPANCLARVNNVKSKVHKGLKLISLGIDKSNSEIKECEIEFAEPYYHEQITEIQGVKLYFSFDKFREIPKQMHIRKVDLFYQLKIKVNDIEQTVDSISIDLDTGSIFNIVY